ncbi:MAG: response regulator [Candidatus Sericytochromatia bacterium]
MSNLETVCIIDDDPIYVFGMKKLISVNNICNSILVFNNGHEAIQYFSSNDTQLPDVIFLDINMPIMDGWDFLDEFSNIKNSFKKNITIHMVSSSIDPNDIEKAKGYQDISEYLVKPVKSQDLKRIFQLV